MPLFTFPSGATAAQGAAADAAKTKTDFLTVTQNVDLDAMETASHAALTLDATVADILGLTGQLLTADDAGADKLIFWDDSAGKLVHASIGSGLTMTDTTLSASGGSSAPTGSRLTGYWSAAPSGYVLANGLTIGNAASSATGRANADTSDLFTLLWTNLDDTLAAVSGGRGASAAADFAANKAITLPDERLRVPVMARSGSNLAGVEGVLGAVGGAETHTLTEAELPVVAGHTHEVFAGTASFDVSGGAGTLVGTYGSVASSSAGGFGSGTAHNNVQPFIAINVAIKL